MTQPNATRVAIVTGANTGIGRVTAETLAREGMRVYLACRSLEKSQPVIDAINAEAGEERARFLKLDLSSLAAVREAASAFLATGEPLHLLVNNAGLAGQRGQTVDGFETHFGVNQLGPYLFTELLLPKLRASAPARIVIVASRAHIRVKNVGLDAVRRPTPSMTGFRQYAQSKLANVLWARELGERLSGAGVTTYAVHPGVIASDIWRRVPAPLRFIAKLFMKNNEEGAATSLYCATAPELAQHTGRYYANAREATASATARDDALARELRARCDAWAGLA